MFDRAFEHALHLPDLVALFSRGARRRLDRRG
jgi:hypothetical protein